MQMPCSQLLSHPFFLFFNFFSVSLKENLNAKQATSTISRSGLFKLSILYTSPAPACARDARPVLWRLRILSIFIFFFGTHPRRAPSKSFFYYTSYHTTLIPPLAFSSSSLSRGQHRVPLFQNLGIDLLSGQLKIGCIDDGSLLVTVVGVGSRLL